MAQATLSTVADVLMRDYDPVIRDQRNNKSILVDKLDKNVGVQPMANNSFYIKARAYGHSGVEFTDGTSAADLNVGAPTYDEMTVSACYGYGSHQLTDTLLASAKGKPGSIVDIADDFAMAVKEAFRKDKNRQWLGLGGTDANNATLAVVNGAVASTTVILEYKNASGVGTATNDMPGLGTRFLHPGDILAVGTDAECGSTTSAAVVVSTIDSRTNFTATGSVTLVDGDLVKKGTGATTYIADDNEMNGMKNLMSASNTFQGVARSTNFWAQAYLDNDSEALDEDDLATAVTEAEDRGGDPNVIIAGAMTYKKYGSLLTSLKRTANTKESLLGGWSGLEFALGGPGMVVVLDNDCYYGDMWVLSLDKKYICVGELDQGWVGVDQGTSMFQKTNLRPSFWASYKFYGNLCVRAPSAFAGLSRKTP